MNDETIELDELTPRQRRLVKNICSDEYPTQRAAGLAAGYKGKSVDGTVSNVLIKPKVLSALDKEKKRLLAEDAQLAVLVDDQSQAVAKHSDKPSPTAAKPRSYQNRIRLQLVQLDKLNELLSRGISEAGESGLDLPLAATLSKLTTDGLAQLGKLKALLPDSSTDDVKDAAALRASWADTVRYAYTQGVQACSDSGRDDALKGLEGLVNRVEDWAAAKAAEDDGDDGSAKGRYSPFNPRELAVRTGGST